MNLSYVKHSKCTKYSMCERVQAKIEQMKGQIQQKIKRFA